MRTFFFFFPPKYSCLSDTGQFEDLKYVIPKVGLTFKQLLFIKLLFHPEILSIGTTLVINNLNNDGLIPVNMYLFSYDLTFKTFLFRPHWKNQKNHFSYIDPVSLSWTG